MEFSEKILDKKEELLDEFENLTLEEIAIRIKKISYDETDLIAKIACLAARVSVLNQRIQEIVKENTANDNLAESTYQSGNNIVEKLLKPSKKPNNIPV